MNAVPLVSIVMPCFNAVAFLPASIGSVLAQTLHEWELIAVDDGSTDDTLAWLQGQRDPRIRVVSQPNQGVSRARNTGLAIAAGDYVAFLDADDTWAPTFLERMLQALTQRPDAVLAYCGWQNVGLPGPRGQPFVPPPYDGPRQEELLFEGCRWPIHAALSRRSAVAKAGGFDTGLTHAEDYLLWLTVAGRSPIVRVPEVLARYHFHGTAQASSQRGRAAVHFWRAQRQYLEAHPDLEARLGRTRVRELTHRRLLERGYECYWAGDLEGARAVFHHIINIGYIGRRDWRYILLTCLPRRWQSLLWRARGGNAPRQ